MSRRQTDTLYFQQEEAKMGKSLQEEAKMGKSLQRSNIS